MAQTIRFHLDENGDPRIATGLRRLGIDITLSDEVGLRQASDDKQLAFSCLNPELSSRRTPIS